MFPPALHIDLYYIYRYDHAYYFLLIDNSQMILLSLPVFFHVCLQLIHNGLPHTKTIFRYVY